MLQPVVKVKKIIKTNVTLTKVWQVTLACGHVKFYSQLTYAEAPRKAKCRICTPPRP